MPPRFYAFWAINGALSQSRLRRQLDGFRAGGFDGVVWHPRFYPNDPPYLSDRYLAEVSDVILHAKSIGLAFWLYDEDGWPSGTVGGQLLKKYPGDAQRWAELVLEKPERCLAEFVHDGRKWFLAERIGKGVDYFNPDLAGHFIELTHERYRTGLKPGAWEHVEAIFCDEPEFGLGHAWDSLSPHGAIPWTASLELLPSIPEIFFADQGDGKRRIQFWELLTDLFNQSFIVPIGNWCKQHGKLFTAHVKGEEHPLFQVPTSGSCHQFFRNLTLPGIDALERYPSNNFFPRQASSAARQFGNGRCMVEAFGGAGWGATPEDLERYLLWLGRHGLTDFVMHLSQYRLDSAAMRDWPPSQPFHLSWHETYPEVLRRVRCELERNVRPAADTLMVAPVRGIMANFEPQEFLQTNVHNAATYPDTPAGRINRRFLERVEQLHAANVNYDIADERTLEQFGQRLDDELVIGNVRYRRVMVDEGCQLSSSATGLVNALPNQSISSPAARIEKRGIHDDTDRGESFSIEWALVKHPTNLLLLECTREADGLFAAQFAAQPPFPDAGMEIVFADDIAEAWFNDHPITLSSSENGSIAQLAPERIKARNILCFQRLASQIQHPFVWLRGLFRVATLDTSEFSPGPNNTNKTDGPFILQPARNIIQQDLLADGFPFLRKSIVVAGTLDLRSAISSLRLDDVEADAVRLSADGNDHGWAWDKENIRFDAQLPAGSHQLRLEIIPNTFNAFGPHHYFGGDWHVISPAQFRGVRNFADPPDAPAKTHLGAWHFRPLRLPSIVSVK